MEEFKRGDCVEVVFRGEVIDIGEVTRCYPDTRRRDEIDLKLASGSCYSGQTDTWAYFGEVDGWRRLHLDMAEKRCFSQRDPGCQIRKAVANSNTEDSI